MADRKQCYSCRVHFLKRRKNISEKRVTESFLQKCANIPAEIKALEVGVFLCPTCYNNYSRGLWVNLRAAQQKEIVRKFLELPQTCAIAETTSDIGNTATEERHAGESLREAGVCVARGYRMGPVYMPSLLPSLMQPFLPEVVVPSPPNDDEVVLDDESYDPNVLWPIDRILGRFYEDQTFKYVVEWKGTWRNGKCTVELISNLVGISYESIVELEKQFDERDELVAVLPTLFPGLRRRTGRVPSREEWESLQNHSVG